MGNGGGLWLEKKGALCGGKKGGKMGIMDGKSGKLRVGKVEGYVWGK